MSGTRTRDEFLARLATALDARVTHAASLAARVEDALPLRTALAELSSLARELRVIARPDDPIPIEKRSLDVVALLVRLFEEKRAHAGPDGIGIEIHPGGSVIGDFDEEHVAAMVFELVSNALKYCSGRPVTVKIRRLGKHALVVVENEGSWIGRRTGFARFERGEVRLDVPGSGIGLWLTQRLAEAHDGTFRVSLRRGVVRTVLALPFHRSDGNLAAFTIRLTPGSSPHGHPPG